MASFQICYDKHNDKDYSRFYKAMDDYGGVRLLESMWGINLENNAAGVREWVKALLDDDDSILVIKLKPTHNWAARNLKKKATDWLHENA